MPGSRYVRYLAGVIVSRANNSVKRVLWARSTMRRKHEQMLVTMSKLPLVINQKLDRMLVKLTPRDTVTLLAPWNRRLILSLSLSLFLSVSVSQSAPPASDRSFNCGWLTGLQTVCRANEICKKSNWSSFQERQATFSQQSKFIDSWEALSPFARVNRAKFVVPLFLFFSFFFFFF